MQMPVGVSAGEPEALNGAGESILNTTTKHKNMQIEIDTLNIRIALTRNQQAFPWDVFPESQHGHEGEAPPKTCVGQRTAVAVWERIQVRLIKACAKQKCTMKSRESIKSTLCSAIVRARSHAGKSNQRRWSVAAVSRRRLKRSSFIGTI